MSITGRDHLRWLADQATPGPWYDAWGTVGAPDCRNIVDCGDPDHEDKANAAFIAAAREAVPDLLDQLDQLDTELDYWMGRAYKAEKQAYRTQARHEQNPYWQREARAQRHRADD